MTQVWEVHESGSVLYTFASPSTVRCWLVQPGGSLEEIQIADMEGRHHLYGMPVLYAEDERE